MFKLVTVIDVSDSFLMVSTYNWYWILGKCLAIIRHGGSTEISSYTGKIWGISNQKYLKNQVLIGFWHNFKCFTSFGHIFSFWDRACFLRSGWTGHCACSAWEHQSQCWNPISTVKLTTPDQFESNTTRLGDWIGTIISVPVPWVRLTVPACQKCANMPEGHLWSDCASLDVPDVPDVLKGLDVVPLCQMAQDCTYGAKFACNDGRLFICPSCDGLMLWVLPKFVTVLIDCRYSLGNTMFSLLTHFIWL